MIIKLGNRRTSVRRNSLFGKTYCTSEEDVTTVLVSLVSPPVVRKSVSEVKKKKSVLESAIKTKRPEERERLN